MTGCCVPTGELDLERSRGEFTFCHLTFRLCIVRIDQSFVSNFEHILKHKYDRSCVVSDMQSINAAPQT